jgi:hypothetical protein
MRQLDKSYIIVRDDTVLVRCYGKEEVKDRLRELLNVLFLTEIDIDEQGQHVIRVDVWMEGKFSGHSYSNPLFSQQIVRSIWSDVLKSDWFYEDTRIEIFETCSTLE